MENNKFEVDLNNSDDVEDYLNPAAQQSPYYYTPSNNNTAQKGSFSGSDIVKPSVDDKVAPTVVSEQKVDIKPIETTHLTTETQPFYKSKWFIGLAIVFVAGYLLSKSGNKN